jgi:DNA (cytosine-5)-methyltransferase 1
MNTEKIQVVDIFCGVGGLTHGLEKAGLTVLRGIDFDETCQYAYEHNNKSRFIHSDIKDVLPSTINDLFDKDTIRVLAGCAPCQPFSSYTRKYKIDENDSRWKLLNYFKEIVLHVQPEIVTVENVPRLSKEKIFFDFIAILSSLKYSISWKIVRCADYGVPQSRRRLVLLASRLGDIDLIPPTHKPTQYVHVDKVISQLPIIEAGETDSYDLLHKSASLTKINLQRIKQSVPGGSWHDWDKKLKLKCHKKKSGSTYVSIYGRMSWGKLAPTITTEFYNIGTGRFGHPEQDRGLSLREGALLQTFPAKYKFNDTKTPSAFSVTARHIGNAVPVRLGYVIGKSIIEHLGKLNAENAKTR